jgi:hypothetical protein
VGSVAIGGLVFACAFGGALVGMLLRARVPEHHLSSESKDVVKMGTGLIATLSALVLGLLIASAKSSFDAQRTGLQQMAAKVVMLDRALAQYGSETKSVRESVRRLVEAAIERLSSQDGSTSSGLGASALTVEGSKLFDQIRQLAPKNDTQRQLQSQALQIGTDLASTRWLLNQQQDSAIPMPFLVVVVFWLAVLFVSFGLFAPPNAIVVTTLLICALSVGGAMFLIVDLDQPFGGLIRISNAPLQHALSHLGQ